MPEVQGKESTQLSWSIQASKRYYYTEIRCNIYLNYRSGKCSRQSGKVRSWLYICRSYFCCFLSTLKNMPTPKISFGNGTRAFLTDKLSRNSCKLTLRELWMASRRYLNLANWPQVFRTLLQVINNLNVTSNNGFYARHLIDWKETVFVSDINVEISLVLKYIIMSENISQFKFCRI